MPASRSHHPTRTHRGTAAIASRLAAVAAVSGLLFVSAVSVGCARNREIITDNDLLYTQAQDKLAGRKFLQAIKLLGQIGTVMPVSDALDPQVRLALADSYFYQGGTVNIVEAQSRYEQFLGFYPLNEQSRYARFQIGVCLLEQADGADNDQEYSRLALSHFQRMARDVPAGDPWGQAARVMMARSENQISEHEWNIGVFYAKREKWQGAIGRFNRLIDNYKSSEHREAAFLQLARAYEQIGDMEQARLTLDRQLAEYPQGPLAPEARALLDQINAADENLAADPG